MMVITLQSAGSGLDGRGDYRLSRCCPTSLEPNICVFSNAYVHCREWMSGSGYSIVVGNFMNIVWVGNLHSGTTPDDKEDQCL